VVTTSAFEGFICKKVKTIFDEVTKMSKNFPLKPFLEVSKKNFFFLQVAPHSTFMCDPS
jgi:hypothetical protein